MGRNSVSIRLLKTIGRRWHNGRIVTMTTTKAPAAAAAACFHPSSGQSSGDFVRQQLHLQQRRSYVMRTAALMDDNDSLPYHIVTGMPALSPTMESGSLAEWYLKEGDAFVAGDALAKIETDKATIDFEAQDDGHVAKLLVPAGDGTDIAIGVPIMVTVEEPDDVDAFANYVLPASEASPPPPPAAAAAAEPEAPPPEPTPEQPAPVAAAIDPPALPSPPPTTIAATTAAPAPTNAAVAWGAAASTASPLAKSLAAKQQAYVDKYGTTGQSTLP